MSFDRMQHTAARQQLRLLGGVSGVFEKVDQNIPVLVLIEKGVQVPSDNGLILEKRTIAALRKAEVDRAAKGARIIVGEAIYIVSEVMADDGYVMRVFVRD